MKYSVSSYSYMKMIRAGEITPFEVIAKTKELGFDAIEFVDFVDFLPLPEEERPAYAEKIRAEAERVGLEISSLTIGADFINGSDGDLQKEIELRNSSISAVFSASSVCAMTRPSAIRWIRANTARSIR